MIVLVARRLFAAILALSLPFPAPAHAGTAIPPERVVWRGMPIDVTLVPGEERAILVPGARSLRAGLIGGPVPGLRVQPLGDRVFVTAAESFRSTRMLLRTDRGETLMLDLRAADATAAPPPPLEIALPRRTTAAERGAGDSGGPQPVSRSIEDAGSSAVGYQRLVRHAARTLYAPPRLVPKDPDIVRVPLRGAAATEGLVRGGCCLAEPIAAWRATGPRGPLWITAVRIENRLDHAVEIDPRTDLRGRWLAVSAQWWRMGPAGADTDVTTIYLLSDAPFRSAAGTVAAAAAPRGDSP